MSKYKNKIIFILFYFFFNFPQISCKERKQKISNPPRNSFFLWGFFIFAKRIGFFQNIKEKPIDYFFQRPSPLPSSNPFATRRLRLSARPACLSALLAGRGPPKRGRGGSFLISQQRKQKYLKPTFGGGA